MTLAADQQAMLGLLLEKGQRYADLATLLGTSESDVRERARAALAELGGADPDRNVSLTDYLLGQADPISRADAVRHLRDDPGDRALAERLLGELRAIAPGAELPKLPGEARTAPHLRARRTGEEEREPRIRTALSKRQTRLIVGAVAAAVIVAVAALAIAGVFSGGGSGGGAATAGTGGNNSTSPSRPQTGQPLRFHAVGGTPARGVVAIGNANNRQAFADVRVANLSQIPKNEAYSVWLMFSSKVGYPLGVINNLSSKGAGHVQLPIPAPLIRTPVRSIDVAVVKRADVANLVREFVRAARNKKAKVAFKQPGQVVLTAPISTKATS